MDNGRVLGGFEHQVLLALLRVGGSGYTVPLVEEIEQATGRAPAAAAVYTTLRRLEDRGMVSSAYEVPAAIGRRIRTFAVEPEGMAALRESKAVLHLLWSDVDGLDPA